MIKITKRFREAYGCLSRPLRATLWFTVMSFFQKGVQFLVTPIYTRLLSTEEYGYYSLYISCYSIISVIATLNLSLGVFNNGMFKYEDDRQDYISSMQGLNSITVLLTTGIITLFFGRLRKIVSLDYSVMIGMMISFFFNPAFLFWSAYQKFTYGYQKLVLATIIYSVATPCISIALICIMPDKGLAAVLGNIIGNTLVGIPFFILNIYRGCFYVKKYWIYALQFNIPLIPHYLSSIALAQLDRVMISYYIGQREVAIYSISYSVSMIMGVVTTSINASFIPWLYQMCRKHYYSNISRVMETITMCIAVLILGLMMFAPECVHILGPSEYQEGIWLIPPMALGCFFSYLYSIPFADLEFYFERNKQITVASLISAIANFVLNLLLIPIYGYKAAAYTTLLCYVFFSVFHGYFAGKICRENGIDIYRNHFYEKVSIGMVLGTVLIMCTYWNTVVRYILVCIICVVVVANKSRIERRLKYVKRSRDLRGSSQKAGDRH